MDWRRIGHYLAVSAAFFVLGIAGLPFLAIGFALFVPTFVLTILLKRRAKHQEADVMTVEDLERAATGVQWLVSTPVLLRYLSYALLIGCAIAYYLFDKVVLADTLLLSGLLMFLAAGLGEAAAIFYISSGKRTSQEDKTPRSAKADGG